MCKCRSLACLFVETSLSLEGGGGGGEVELVPVETRKPVRRTLTCSTPTPSICTGKQLAHALHFAGWNMLTVVATGTRLRV